MRIKVGVEAPSCPVAELFPAETLLVLVGTYPREFNGISHGRCVMFRWAVGQRLAGAQGSAPLLGTEEEAYQRVSRACLLDRYMLSLT